MKVRCCLRDSSDWDASSIWLTTELRMPWHCSLGSTFHLVLTTSSRTCSPRYFVGMYVASCNILSTINHASGFDLKSVSFAPACFCPSPLPSWKALTVASSSATETDMVDVSRSEEDAAQRAQPFRKEASRPRCLSDMLVLR